MESILKSDVFFFVTTVAICIVTSLLIMILVEVLQVVKDVRYISRHIRKEAENLSSDFAAFRAMLSENQYGLKPVFDGIKKTVSSFTSKVKTKVPRKKKEEKVTDPFNY